MRLGITTGGYSVEQLQDADLPRADFVMISAMIVHEESVRNMTLRSAALGKCVIAGGHSFTTGREVFPEIGHFVLGEADEIIGQDV